MRTLSTGLALLAILACTETSTAPTPDAPRPTPSVVSTTATVTFGGDIACGTRTNSLYPPLVFTPGWSTQALNGCGSSVVTDHTGDGSGFVVDVVTPTLTPGFSLATPAKTVGIWVFAASAGTVDLTVAAWNVNGGVATRHYTAVRTWTYVEFASMGDIDRVEFYSNNGSQASVALDDVAVTTETTVPDPIFAGFFHPVDNGGVLNVAKAGSSLPVKFALGGDFGLGVLMKVPTATAIPCPTGAGSDAIEEVASSPSGLSYDATSGQYIYVWKTQPSWKGTCKQLHMPLIDGVDHTAVFQFR